MLLKGPISPAEKWVYDILFTSYIWVLPEENQMSPSFCSQTLSGGSFFVLLSLYIHKIIAHFSFCLNESDTLSAVCQLGTLSGCASVAPERGRGLWPSWRLSPAAKKLFRPDEETRPSMKLPSWLSFAAPKKLWKPLGRAAGGQEKPLWMEGGGDGGGEGGRINRKKPLWLLCSSVSEGLTYYFAGVAVSLALAAVGFDPINL